MSAFFKVILILIVSALSAPVMSAPLERQLDVHLAVNANQSWRDELQWIKSTTRQRYDWSTRLQSDGRLYADNLLDPDPKRRLSIKRNYELYQGLLQLKQENGGRLPSANQAMTEISTESLLRNPDCFLGSENCPKAAPGRPSAVKILQQNSAEAIDKIIKSYDAPGGQWLYFTGYVGCPNSVKLNYRSHFAGERVFDRGKKELKAFETDWTANTKGTAQEQKHLCQRYVATLNTVSGDFYIENVFIPSPHGMSAQTIDGEIDKQEVDLPPPYEVRQWVNDLLKKARTTGQQQATLPLNTSLDGNLSMSGSFVGTASVQLSWSFDEPTSLTEPR